MRIVAVEGTDADGVEDLFFRAGGLMDAARLPRLTPVGWFLPEAEESGRFYAGFAVTEQVPDGLEVSSFRRRWWRRWCIAGRCRAALLTRR